MLSETPSCPVCTAVSHFRFGGCHVIHYCGTEHQGEDWESHKAVRHNLQLQYLLLTWLISEPACNANKKAQWKLAEKDAGLRNNNPSEWGPDVFEWAGHFGDLWETEEYMRARDDVIESLLRIRTYAAVSAAHETLMGTLPLCRRGSWHAQFKIPAIKLRLGRDQDCYDFLKWWGAAGKDPHYDFGDMSLPYLDLKGENAFEKLWHDDGTKPLDLNLTIALLLRKVKLRLDLDALHTSLIYVGEKVPQEILDNIQDRPAVSEIVTSKKKVD